MVTGGEGGKNRKMVLWRLGASLKETEPGHWNLKRQMAGLCLYH